MNPDYHHTGIEIEVVIGVATERDEFWSYAGSKADQRWIRYLINRNNGDIIAWKNGRRTDKVFVKLLDSVKIFLLKFVI